MAARACASRRVGWALLLGTLLPSLWSCETVDPGPNFVAPDIVFNANYFYCHVEPGLIFQYSCGSGDPSQGDKPNGCHFNPSAVSGMALLDHPAVDCGGGDAPIDPTQIATGSPAQSNLEAVSLEMSKDYTSAPIYVRPSDVSGCPPPAHPRCVFQQSDQNVTQLLQTWASL